MDTGEVRHRHQHCLNLVLNNCHLLLILSFLDARYSGEHELVNCGVYWGVSYWAGMVCDLW